jgi:hypothetical protein
VYDLIEFITSFLAMLRQSGPVFLIGIAIASGAMLLFSENIANILGVTDFRNQYRGYIGAIFIISSSVIIAQASWWVIKWLRSFHTRRISKKARHSYLQNLTPDEKAYLIPFVVQDENTQYFSIQDGIAGGLSAKNIIYQATSVGNMFDGFAYNIQPWAKEYLKKNLHLLEGANPDPNNPQKRRPW